MVSAGRRHVYPPTHVGDGPTTPGAVARDAMSEPSTTSETTQNVASCSLSETGERDRVDWAREHIVPHYREGELLADGLRASFDATAESLVAIARLIEKESGCCGSFVFELHHEPPYEEVELRITGPDGTRDLLERGFVERFEPVDAATERDGQR